MNKGKNGLKKQEIYAQSKPVAEAYNLISSKDKSSTVESSIIQTITVDENGNASVK